MFVEKCLALFYFILLIKQDSSLRTNSTWQVHLYTHGVTAILSNFIELHKISTIFNFFFINFNYSINFKFIELLDISMQNLLKGLLL